MVLATAGLGGCASNPTGGTDFVLMSEKRELEIGKEEHEKLMKEIRQFGEFEIVPKKGYVSLRRKKQFVMIGPKTNTANSSRFGRMNR